MTGGSKRCFKCRQILRLESFYVRSDGHGCGYSSRCKPCHRRYCHDKGNDMRRFNRLRAELRDTRRALEAVRAALILRGIL